VAQEKREEEAGLMLLLRTRAFVAQVPASRKEEEAGRHKGSANDDLRHTKALLQSRE
jgi:hypothetical protein